MPPSRAKSTSVENVASDAAHGTADTAWSGGIFRGIRPNDLSGKAGEIASELEERLIAGQYRFGQSLSIYTLASQFGASRQPVAAAVLYLRSVGYLEIIPQVGCRVVSPLPEEVHDFYTLFSRTEGTIGRFAAERHTEKEGQELIAIAAELARNAFSTTEERRAMGHGISHFHERMSEMARSPLLVERISNLRRIFRFYLRQTRRRFNRSTEVPVRLNELRQQLARGIAKGDANAVEAMVNEYILGALEDWSRVV